MALLSLCCCYVFFHVTPVPPAYAPLFLPHLPPHSAVGNRKYCFFNALITAGSLLYFVMKSAACQNSDKSTE